MVIVWRFTYFVMLLLVQLCKHRNLPFHPSCLIPHLGMAHKCGHPSFGGAKWWLLFCHQKTLFTSLYVLYIPPPMLHLCTQIPLSKCTSCILTFPHCSLCIVATFGYPCMGSSHTFVAHLPANCIEQAVYLHHLLHPLINICIAFD